MSLWIVIAALAAQASADAQPPAPPDAAAAFARLQALAGNWRGRRPDGREIGVSYRLSAGGTVLVETWALGPGRESLTLYHMDGVALVASHYCPQGNQPRLAMVRAAGNRMDFAFRDATGLDPGEAYQHDFWIEIGADGAITRSETYVEGEESVSETITYWRVGA